MTSMTSYLELIIYSPEFAELLATRQITIHEFTHMGRTVGINRFMGLF